MVDGVTKAKAAAAPRSFADQGRVRYVALAALTFVYTLNVIDRQILSILAEPVKLDLGLSDTQLGMLTGLAFAVFYTVFGIPVAVIADRWNRVRVVAAACGLWSLFTALSGMATGFVTLAFARVGVGIGEAGCSPPAYSILADYFAPERRGRALAIYLLGVPAGMLAGTMASGWIASHYGWRAAFFAVGVTGLAVAPLIPLIVREPRRGTYDAPTSETHSSGSFRDALRLFVGTPALILNAIAAGLTSLVNYGLINWLPAFLTRVQGMTLAQVASYYSLVLFGSMIGAAWLGAVFSDRFGARNPIWYALLPGLGLPALIPFLFGFTMAGSWQLSLLLLIPPVVLSSTYLVPALALLQNRTPARFRATTSAMLLFVINLVGLGCGPLLVGAISDRLTPTYGADALGYALQWLAPFALLALGFQCASAWAIRREQKPRTGPDFND